MPTNGITIITQKERQIRADKKTDIVINHDDSKYYIRKDSNLITGQPTKCEITISEFNGKKYHNIYKIFEKVDMPSGNNNMRSDVHDASKTAVKVENKPEKAVDWEKVNTGKVRFHFSIEAFKLWCSLNHDKIQCGLNAELIAQIRTWTSFVMQDAIEDSNLDTPDNDGTDIPF